MNYFQKQYSKVSAKLPFVKIGKFKIGLNLVEGPMEIMQIMSRAFLKCSYTRTIKRKLISSSPLQWFVAHFSKFLSSYILSWFRLSFYFLHPCKESNVSCFDDTMNFTICQKVIASRVYIVNGCERVLLKENFFLFVILKAFFWPAKSERTRRKWFKYTFTIFPFLIHSADIDSNTFSP